MKDYKPRCSCGVYTGYNAQNGIRYGCKYTPDPEPLDEENFCNKCAGKEQLKFEAEIIKNGEGVFRYCNWWQSPLFVKQALAKTGYIMTRSSDNTHFTLKLLPK